MSRTTKLFKSTFGHSEMVGVADINIRRTALKLITLVAGIMTISFSTLSYLEMRNIQEFLLRMFPLLPYIISLVVMGYGGLRLLVAFLLTLVPLFGTFISMFYNAAGAVENVMLFQGIWILCVPFIAILAGVKLAAISCLIVFVFMTLICFVPGFGHDYPGNVSFRYLATYVTNCIFAFAYALSKSKLHHEYLKELKALGQIDPLTGVLNRRGFQLYADELWIQALRDRLPLSFLIIDLCNFKKFNDDYGHQNGDLFLIKCVKVLRKQVRSPLDLVVRPGGKEFGVLLFNTPEKEAETIGKKVKAILQKETFGVSEDNNVRTGIQVNTGIASIDFSDKSERHKFRNLDEMFASAGKNLH